MHSRHLVLLLLTLAVVVTLPAGARVTILPLGDSITRGDTTADSTSGSYRYYLYTSLVSAGYDVDFVGSTTHPGFTRFTFDQDHDGHGGYTTGMYLSYQGKEPLRSWLAASSSPDYVLLHLGTNDAIQQVPMATRLANLRAIVGILREKNPDVTILLAQLIPTADAYRNTHQVVPFNNALPALAADCSTSSSRILVVDQYTGYDGVTENGADGIHPTASGMKRMASTWSVALTPLLSPPPIQTLPTIPLPTTSGITVPGAIGPARSLEGDGLYRDVNGNGRRDFADVVLFFNHLDWCAANAPSAFDFNANGRIDFGDVTRLFESLS